ncbi:TPA: hypothetical protein U1C23_001152 [Streptococcus suis]|nr:hypothetical protein [Streptococcus suis]
METTNTVKEITLQARNEAEAHKMISDFFSDVELPKNSSFSISNIFNSLFKILGILFIILFKLIKYVVLTPIFAFFWIRNAIFMGLGIALIYGIIGSLYYANTGRAHLDMTVVLWTETRVYTIAGIALFLALLVTLDDFKKMKQT